MPPTITNRAYEFIAWCRPGWEIGKNELITRKFTLSEIHTIPWLQAVQWWSFSRNLKLSGLDMWCASWHTLSFVATMQSNMGSVPCTLCGGSVLGYNWQWLTTGNLSEDLARFLLPACQLYPRYSLGLWACAVVITTTDCINLKRPCT